MTARHACSWVEVPPGGRLIWRVVYGLTPAEPAYACQVCHRAARPAEAGAEPPTLL